MKTLSAPGPALLGIAVAALVMLPPAALSAQASAGPQWNAWLGCWEPQEVDGPDAFNPPDNSTAVCILPVSETEVEYVTVADRTIERRDRIDTSGRPVNVDIDGCEGVETAEWSADGRRLFLRGDLTCAGNIARTSQTVFAISPNGSWVSSEAVTVDDVVSLRVVRYRSVDAVPAVGIAASRDLSDRRMALRTARSVASAPVSLAEVVEAVNVAGAPAVEGWLIEQRQPFDVDADALAYLASADLPDSVIDLLVALSYPNVFAIDQDSRESERMARGDGPNRWPGRYPRYYPAYRGGYYPGYYGGWYGRPVVIVRGASPNRDSGGRAVNGRGYSRGRGSSSGSPSISPSGGGSDAASPSGGSGGSPGSSDTGRTAKPRSDR